MNRGNQQSGTASSKSAKSESRKDNSRFDGDEQQQEGARLDHLLKFVKENWKPILTDLVAVGVATYMTHIGKDKNKAASAKTKMN